MISRRHGDANCRNRPNNLDHSSRFDSDNGDPVIVVISIAIVSVARSTKRSYRRISDGTALLLFTAQFDEQTLIVFIPLSASARVLYTVPEGATTVIDVSVGFLSTIVHFLVFVSWTT
jgi:hypothetical protein